ncbi:MAG: prepilin-type N-terminal cleavage/methylation domain-containing protein [Myxococcales bacterium]|nr:prepilin-type N-terminal cleavage/methylation domain-containing protein [Myxococcales bacterium]
MDVRQQGFSLAELMVVVVLLGVLVAGVMSSFTTQKKSVSVNSQIVDAQQSARLLGDLLEEDIRHAGLLVPESAALCGVDNTNAPDVLFVSDAAAIRPDDEINTSLGARIGGGSGLVGGNNVQSGVFTVDSLVLEQATPDPAYDTDADGTADSDFRVGAGVIVTDAGNPTRGSACGTITAVNLAGPSVTVTLDSGALGALPGSPDPVDMVVVPAHVYRITGAMQLQRNGMTIAGDVEDLQVAVFVDLDDDRTIDVGEYRGDGVGANFDPSGTDMSLAREVRTNLVVRTRLDDPDNPNGRFQDAENRAGPAGADGFRRRTYSSTVMLRNVGGRVSTV